MGLTKMREKIACAPVSTSVSAQKIDYREGRKGKGSSNVTESRLCDSGELYSSIIR